MSQSWQMQVLQSEQMTASIQHLAADEQEFLRVVRDVKKGTGHGEVSALVQNGRIVVVKATNTYKLS